MGQHIALLRGINVGGKNVIPMAALRACFEQLGYDDVRTYIQSGNVAFAASGAKAKLTTEIERALAKTFGYDASVVMRSEKQMRTIVETAPDGFGTLLKKYRYDVLFLKEPLTAKQALEKVPTRPGVDAAYAGTGVLYFSRLIAKATQSRLSRLTSMPIYQSMTVRNWNTTTRLLSMMREG